MLEEFQPANPGHAHICDDTSELPGTVASQEGFSAVKCPARMPIYLQEVKERFAHRFIVVDDCNDRSIEQTVYPRGRHLKRG
jgi:hypothetical protein